ncbi:MFS transporter [Andreprevotia chitinilytica]|uniref:MFS transporter n=1 Tax=Andreprevotia chitinilytica TaxID=396808 RepID=UPI0005531C87|nr:MFS transporter [Andreprevotia chitinilytica]
MSAEATLAAPLSEPPAISTWLTLLLATACGLIAANLYYAQPLIGPISAALGLSPQAAGLIVTMTQVGYGAGLLLIVPLGDLFENRRLIACVISLGALAEAAAALVTHSLPFLLAALCIGLGSVAVQILVPFAAHLAPEARRGQVVGNVMSGLMLGIMLARPVASFITDVSSWHVVFTVAAVVMVLLVVVLSKTLPVRRPAARLRYGELLASMGRMALTTPILQRRALYQACLFGAFSLFWTTTPLLLAGPQFRLSQSGIALFALAGVAGAVAAPIAGRFADRGWSRLGSGLAMLTAAGAFLLTHIAQPGSLLALALLVAAAILLDFGVTANLVFGQRAIFALGAEHRSRLNGLYMATFFAGGAVGSAFGGWAFAQGGWALTSWVGFALPVAALLYYATEYATER